LQRGPELAEQLADFTRSAAAVVMVMVSQRSLHLRRLILKVLLDGRKILLRRREVARLKILGQLAERLRDRTVALRGRTRILRRQILQRGKIRLRRRQIPSLQILTELLEFLTKLLRAALNILGAIETAAGNTRNGHEEVS